MPPLSFGDPVLDDLLGGLLRQPASYQMIAAPREAAFPALEEEEADSLLSKVGAGAMGGLAWVGDVLDKPGRGVRGVISNALQGDLGGIGRSLANFVPGYETVDWLLGDALPNPTNVEGRDLLEQVGLFDQNQAGMPTVRDAAQDFAGFVLGEALNPLTYVGFAPLTASGKAAKAGGTLTKGLAPSIAAGERSLAGIVNPLKAENVTNMPFWTGSTAQDVAGKLDIAGDWLKYENPVGRTLNNMFDSDIANKGAMTAQGQRSAKAVAQAERAAKAAEAQEPIKLFNEVSGDDFLRANESVIRQAEEGITFAPAGVERQRAAVTWFDNNVPVTEELIGPMPASLGDELLYGNPALKSQAETLQRGYDLSQDASRLALKSLGLPANTVGVIAPELLDDAATRAADYQRLIGNRYNPLLDVIEPLPAGSPRTGEFASAAGDFLSSDRAIAPYQSIDLAPAQRMVLQAEADLARTQSLKAAMSPEQLGELQAEQALNLPKVGRAAEIGQRLRQLQEPLPLIEQKAGLPGRVLQDPAGVKYGFRQANWLGKAQEQAERSLRGIPGGTEQIKRASIDQQIAGPNRLLPFETKRTEITAMLQGRGNLSPEMSQTIDNIAKGIVTGDDINTVAKNFRPKFANQAEYDTFARSLRKIADQDPNEIVAKSLAKDYMGTPWEQGTIAFKRKMTEFAEQLGKMPPDRVAKSKPLFDQNAISDTLMRQLATVEKTSRANWMRDLGDTVGVEFPERAGIEEFTDPATGNQYVSILKMYDDAKIGNIHEQGKELVGAIPTVAKRNRQKVGGIAGRRALGTGEKIAGELDKISPKDAAREQLSTTFVPREIYADAVRGVQAFESPEFMKGLVDTTDKMLNAFRAGVYNYWPSSMGRNAISAAAYRFVAGATDPTPGLGFYQRFVKPGMDAWDMLNGRPINLDGLVNQVGAPMTMPEFLSEYQAMQVGFGKGTQTTERIGDELASITPYEAKPFKQRLPDMKENLRGFSGLKEGVGRIGTTLEKAGEFTEEWNQLSHYIARRRQGYTPFSAMEDTKKWHFNYNRDAFTPFERQIMKRLVPFYSFMKSNTPLVVGELLQRPGGPMATAIKASNQVRPDEGFVPGYIAEQASIPVGGEDADGNRRFITSLGLPWEEPFQRFKFGPEGMSRTFDSLLGSLRPELKAPLELFADRSLFSGRPLEQLQDPLPFMEPLGLPTSLGTLGDELLMTSPASRAITQLRRATDPRKGLGTLLTDITTGIKVTDARTDAARREAEATLNALLEQVPGNVHMEMNRFPAARVSELTEEQRKLYQLQKTIDANRRRIAAEANK